VHAADARVDERLHAASECAADRELCELSMMHVMPASMQPSAVIKLPT
jgi:hypothetical protein